MRRSQGRQRRRTTTGDSWRSVLASVSDHLEDRECEDQCPTGNGQGCGIQGLAESGNLRSKLTHPFLQAVDLYPQDADGLVLALQVTHPFGEVVESPFRPVGGLVVA